MKKLALALGGLVLVGGTLAAVKYTPLGSTIGVQDVAAVNSDNPPEAPRRDNNDLTSRGMNQETDLKQDGVASVLSGVRTLTAEQVLSRQSLFGTRPVPEGFDLNRMINYKPELLQMAAEGKVQHHCSYNYEYAREMGVSEPALDNNLRVSAVRYEYQDGLRPDPADGDAPDPEVGSGPYYFGSARFEIPNSGIVTLVVTLGKDESAPPIRGRSSMVTHNVNRLPTQ